MKLVPRDKVPILNPEMRHDFGILWDKDLVFRKRGRLKMKILVFENKRGLNDFFDKLHQSPQTYQTEKEAAGWCMDFLSEHYVPPDYTKTKYMSADRTYFCWMGFVKDMLYPDIVSHECVHAAFDYERRVRRNLFGKIGEFDEERIAYGTGWIFWCVNYALTRAGFLK